MSTWLNPVDAQIFSSFLFLSVDFLCRFRGKNAEFRWMVLKKWCNKYCSYNIYLLKLTLLTPVSFHAPPFCVDRTLTFLLALFTGHVPKLSGSGLNSRSSTDNSQQFVWNIFTSGSAVAAGAYFFLFDIRCSMWVEVHAGEDVKPTQEFNYQLENDSVGFGYIPLLPPVPRLLH